MKIVLLGSGNVATHLGKALKKAGHEILQVWSRTKKSALQLAELLNATAISNLDALSAEADIYIISVPDEAIGNVASTFAFPDKLLVHTSGTTSLEALSSASNKTGVFYPIQTFSKQRQVDFSSTPIAVEGNSEEVSDSLFSLAESLSDKVVFFDSEKRKALHVAAVFACNFSNHLYALAKTILGENSLEFDLIRPLIKETAGKAQNFFPEDVQTGPAVRMDFATIEKHLEFLENQPELQQLYEKLSQSIINLHQKG